MDYRRFIIIGVGMLGAIVLSAYIADALTNLIFWLYFGSAYILATFIVFITIRHDKNR
jgi:hypothetical protein